jgi:hypothetical protein
MNVRVFTARASSNKERVQKVIEKWCRRHIGVILPVTCRKDYDMIAFWDDKAIPVEENTGVNIVKDLKTQISNLEREIGQLTLSLHEKSRETAKLTLLVEGKGKTAKRKVNHKPGN